MYCNTNFPTKRALKEAVKAAAAATRLGLSSDADLGPDLGIHQPGPFGGAEPSNGVVCCEGPHYPKPHRWYAECTVKDGVIVKVK